MSLLKCGVLQSGVAPRVSKISIDFTEGNSPFLYGDLCLSISVPIGPQVLRVAGSLSLSVPIQVLFQKNLLLAAVCFRPGFGQLSDILSGENVQSQLGDVCAKPVVPPRDWSFGKNPLDFGRFDQGKFALAS